MLFLLALGIGVRICTIEDPSSGGGGPVHGDSLIQQDSTYFVQQDGTSSFLLN